MLPPRGAEPGELRVHPCRKLGVSFQMVLGYVIAHALQLPHDVHRCDGSGGDAAGQRGLRALDVADQGAHHQAWRSGPQ